MVDSEVCCPDLELEVSSLEAVPGTTVLGGLNELETVFEAV